MLIETFLIKQHQCVVCGNSYGIPKEGKYLCEEHCHEDTVKILDGVLTENISVSTNITEDKVIEIVDACFHAFASSHRSEAKKMARSLLLTRTC